MLVDVEDAVSYAEVVDLIDDLILSLHGREQSVLELLSSSAHSGRDREILQAKRTTYTHAKELVLELREKVGSL